MGRRLGGHRRTADDDRRRTPAGRRDPAAAGVLTRLPAELGPRLARTAHNSVGGALALANRTSVNDHPALANAVHAAASNAFFHGFSAACLVAAGVSAVAAIGSLVLLPAHPETGLTLALESE